MAEIKIDIKDVEFIMGDDYANHFDKIVNNVFCTKCEGSFGNKVTEIVFYETYLNDFGDIVLRGKCRKCNADVVRVIETSENLNLHKKINAVKEHYNKKKQ